MKKKIAIAITSLLIVTLGSIVIFNTNKGLEETNTIEATILSKDEATITVKDSSNGIYTFETNDATFDVGTKVVIEYTGLLNRGAEVKEIKLAAQQDIDKIKGLGTQIDPDWLDGGIFGKYYTLAFNKLKKMTLDERIAQLLLVQYPSNDPVGEMKKYQFGGYIFFEKDFKDKTEQEVQKMMNDVQEVAKIPALTAVDEEGGTVVRVSSNDKLVKEKFKSPSELYTAGELDAIKKDTIEKSRVLSNLGLNLNLAPVVDVTESSSDYIYPRALQKGTEITSGYAKTVIAASKGTGVSYTLKHFPGYGNNKDTHEEETIDNRSYQDIMKNDIPPFEAGIDAGAEAVLVGHMKITNIDQANPASLSTTVHNLLRDELDFTGVIMTDDLSMGALGEIEDVAVKALKAGNDILLVTDYKSTYDALKKAVDDGSLSEDIINKAAFRIIAWKYYKGLLYENQK